MTPSPAPVAITIRNFFPPALASKSSPPQKQQQDDNTKNFSYTRGDYINLPSCQLDIIEKCDNDERIIYSQSSGGAHPHWNHVNEHIQDNLDRIHSLMARLTVENKSIETPLDPSQLKRISQSDTMTIPDSLPPNAILIHYDDGWTRVLPGLYTLLVKRQIIQDCIEIVQDDGNIFSESAFDTLGDVNNDDDTEIPTQSEVVVAQVDTVYDDKVFDLLGESNNQSSTQAVKVADGTSELTGPSTTLYTADQDDNSNVTNSEANDSAGKENKHHTATTELPDPPSSLTSGLDEATRIQNEVARLRTQVEYEQEQLEIEEMMIHQVSTCYSFALVYWCLL